MIKNSTPQKLNLQTLHKNPHFPKSRKNLNPTPQVHILEHNTKTLNPYLGHEFCSILKLANFEILHMTPVIGEVMILGVFNLKTLKTAFLT